MAQVYELITKPNGVSYSPFVIWTELYLKHKNIDFVSVPLTFSEIGPTIKKLTNDEWALVPTIKFENGDIVFDSVKIAEYLDKAYPDNPIMKDNPNTKRVAVTFFGALGFCTYKLILLDIDRNMDPASQKVMRSSKEKEFGITLEEYSGDAEANIKQFYSASEGLIEILAKSPFLEGDTPAYWDYATMGMLQSARTINPEIYSRLIDQNPYPEISAWASRMNELFDGHLKHRKTL